MGIDHDDHEVAAKIRWSAGLVRLWKSILNVLILPIDKHLSPSTRVSTHFREDVDVWITAVLTKIGHDGVV